MVRQCVAALGVSLALAFPIPSFAVWITISDASQVQYQTEGSGKVYFRNFDQFDSVNALPCCYNYWVDTLSLEGRNIWAVFLTDFALGKPFRIAIPDARQPGVVSAAGSW